jgi:hypothetical protein
MKKLLLLVISLCTIGFAFGQSNLSPTQVGFPIAPASTILGAQEIFRFQPGLVTQLQQGPDFDFGPDTRWFSLGQLDAGSQTFYGSRFQYDESAFVTGYTDASPTKPRIEWIHNGGSTADYLEFRVGNGFGSMGMPGTNTLVASMSPLQANTYFGTEINTSNPFGDNADSPKVGIATARKLNFSIQNTTAFNTVGATTTGARISAQSTTSSGTVTGIFNNAQGGSTSEGIVSRASGENISIAIQGITPQTTNNTFSVAIYGRATDTDNNRFAGLFEGDVTVTGGTFVSSDRKLKKEITSEKSVLEKIALLNPVTYSFKETEGIVLPTTVIQHGFISQEMAEVFPELTKDITKPVFDKDGKIVSDLSFKAINYTGLISVLTAGIQELNNEVTALKEELNDYKANDQIRRNIGQDNGEASGYSMEQNIPNPFEDRSVIRYRLASGVENASILVFDLNGRLLKEYPINQNEGQVTVLGGEIGKGMFIYSLTQNGQEIISKKMIVK